MLDWPIVLTKSKTDSGSTETNIRISQSEEVSTDETVESRDGRA